MKKDQVLKEKDHIIRLAGKNMAEDEHWSGYTDKDLWARAIGMTEGASENLRPAISEDCVLYTHLLRQEGLKEVLDNYCLLRGEEILAEIKTSNAALREAIKRVKEIHKLYAKQHRPGHVDDPTRHTTKYVVALLIVMLITALLGGNGT